MLRQMRWIWVLAVVWGLGVSTGAWGQTTWHVDDDGAGDPGPGDSSVSDPLEDGSILHPFDAIQEGIVVAVNGDTVMVLDGIYTGVGNRDIDFLGKAITVISENGPGGCIVDCGGTWSDPHRGFTFHHQEENDSVLSGITIYNGNPGNNNGGGILCEGGSPSINNCIIRNCRGARGGGIYSKYGGHPVVSFCEIYLNESSGGGGIYSYGDISLNDCRVYSNKALDGGGLGVVGQLVMSRCVIQDNTADQGGGIEIMRGLGNKIDNSLFYGNQSFMGGGIFINESDMVMHNCTFSGNEAFDGKALNTMVFFPDARTSHIHIVNSIIWEGESGIWKDRDFTELTLENCDVQGGWEGINNIDVDPLFVDAAGGDYRLQTESPCIDAGDNGEVTEAFDLDGRLRIFDGNGDGEAVVDMGSYEFVMPNSRPVAEAGEDVVVWAEPNGVALVKLDGSGSFDADGDALTYRWSCAKRGTGTCSPLAAPSQSPFSLNGDGVVNMLDFALWARGWSLGGRHPQTEFGGATQGDAGKVPAVQMMVELAGFSRCWLSGENHGYLSPDFTSGASLVIELPVGVYEVRLVVNDGVEDSEPDTCVVTVLGAGDLDRDGEVDLGDLEILLAGRGEAASGPDDPRDLDGDGIITVADGRILVTLFTEQRNEW